LSGLASRRVFDDLVIDASGLDGHSIITLRLNHHTTSKNNRLFGPATVACKELFPVAFFLWGHRYTGSHDDLERFLGCVDVGGANKETPSNGKPVL